jgi:hypothetical protein
VVVAQVGHVLQMMVGHMMLEKMNGHASHIVHHLAHILPWHYYQLTKTVMARILLELCCMVEKKPASLL